MREEPPPEDSPSPGLEAPSTPPEPTPPPTEPGLGAGGLDVPPPPPTEPPPPPPFASPPPPPPLPSWESGSPITPGMAAPYPGYPVPPPPSGSRTGIFIAIVAVVTVLTLVIVAVGVVVIGMRGAKHTTGTVALGPMTASTTASADRGTVVFSDDFHDSTSGWSTDTLPSGTTFSYSPSGYVVVAKGTLNHFATAPYTTPVQQVAIALTATQSSDAPAGAGYGVSCWRGADTAQLRYDFIVTTGGDWEVDRIDGSLTNLPDVLKSGTSSATIGTTPLTIHGMCATLGDLHTTRLILFLGTQEIADFTNSATAVPDTGWQTELIVSSEKIRTSTVTATRFEVRDLAR